MGIFDPNQDVILHLKKFECEQCEIDNRRYEIQREINALRREDANLLDRYNLLETLSDNCRRALSGEPIAIWAEIHRL